MKVDNDSDLDYTREILESRVTLQGLQTLTAFLIILPFTEGFRKITEQERMIYAYCFAGAFCGLILFTAPVVHLRLKRQIGGKAQFKTISTLMCLGLLAYSFTLATLARLVLEEVFPKTGLAAGALCGIFILIGWWIPGFVGGLMEKKAIT